MDDGNIPAGFGQPRAQLQDAARIRAHDHVGRGGEDRLHLLPLQLARDLRMREVVDPRAAATPFGVTYRHELDAGDRLQERARLAADLLPVREVAGVLIDHARLPSEAAWRHPG